MLTVESIVDQHSHQASFVFGLRTSAVSAPHYNLSDLATLDNRLEAHIDGLRIAGEDGWQRCCRELAWEESEEVFAAAVLALESGDRSKIDSVLKAATKKPGLARGFISALGWLEYKQAEACIKSLCASQSPAEKRMGIAAASIHRQDPGQALNEALSDSDVLLRARALRAVGELGRLDLVSFIQRDLSAEDTSCRSWAAWSTALLVGYASAIEVLQSIAESASPYREPALQIALRKMDLRSAHFWQERMARNPKILRAAVMATGIIGDPSRMQWLIEQMKFAPVARVAGESFSMITGVDIAYEDLDMDKPEGFESGPTEDPKDDNVEMDPDERLPWPNANLIAKWWDKHAGEFQTGVRHLVGKPITAAWAEEVLQIGRQRQRAAAALELAILRPGSPLFETRAPGFRQQEVLELRPR
jgi:uncharacterized protein (TIGR02270 family)